MSILFLTFNKKISFSFQPNYIISLCFILILFSYFLSSCSTYRLEKKLDPESKEFLSLVRYIITPQERKIFLNTPPDERTKFIEEFWKKRDPDPETEENEFKEEYFKRIEEANHLFGSNGWLQDRGRVYILLGPPERKEVYPRGYTFYGKPMEIWYYGFFPIVFIDHYWNGNYKLEALSAYQIAQINKAQMEEKPQVKDKSTVLDFDIKIISQRDDQLIIRIEIPYKNIWFKQEEDKLTTTLEISLKIFNSQEKKIWEFQQAYPISIEEKNLTEIIKKPYIIEIPVNLAKAQLFMTIDLMNTVDKSKVHKKIKIKL